VSWLQQYAWVSIPIAGLAMLFTGWNALNTWKRDVSRFRFQVTYPPSYKRDDIAVTAVYKGGPPLKVTKARVRVVRMSRLRWFERAPAGGVDAILRPENREVPVLLDAEYEKHFWYVEVLTDGGAKRRKFLRWIPPFWLKEVELGLMSIDKVGGVGDPKRLEKALGNVVKEARKDQKEKQKRKR